MSIVMSEEAQKRRGEFLDRLELANLLAFTTLIMREPKELKPEDISKTFLRFTEHVIKDLEADGTLVWDRTAESQPWKFDRASVAQKAGGQS